MLQDTSIIDNKHKKFIERIIEFEIVWALQSDEGFAVSESNDFEKAEVIPFWSDKAYAKAVAKAGWQHYEPEPMPLSDFIENYLVGMHSDGLVVGTNWDANMFGKEIEPLDLALEIAEVLISKRKNLELLKFKNISDYHLQVKRAWGVA
jgi:hypothetical protein